MLKKNKINVGILIISIIIILSGLFTILLIRIPNNQLDSSNHSTIYISHNYSSSGKGVWSGVVEDHNISNPPDYFMNGNLSSEDIEKISFDDNYNYRIFSEYIDFPYILFEFELAPNPINISLKINGSSNKGRWLELAPIPKANHSISLYNYSSNQWQVVLTQSYQGYSIIHGVVIKNPDVFIKRNKILIRIIGPLGEGSLYGSDIAIDYIEIVEAVYEE
jgi:hypothetical protein